MGSEVKCRVRFGKQESEGKALLETSEIICRGDFRLKLPFATIQSVKVVGDDLQVETADGVAIFGDVDVDVDLLALLQTLNSARVATWCWVQARFPEMRRHGKHHFALVRNAWPRAT